MPYFKQDVLVQLAEGFDAIAGREQYLRNSFISRQYKSEDAREYAIHGVGRRLGVLAHCIKQIFTRLPPETDNIPTREVLLDTTVCIQAFVFNTFGLLDNLAFVWVNEKNIKKPNGQPLPNGRVGLTADKTEVRQSFSAEMQAYLATRDDWIKYLENFRHSLGHRIPLYIAPYTVNFHNEGLYQDLEARKITALFENDDLVEHDILEAEQSSLRLFRPWMQHSLNNPKPPVVFYAQVLADFATVEEVCQRVLAELDQ